MELTWKDTNTNFLPESGLFSGQHAAEVLVVGPGSFEFTTQGGKRTATLTGSAVTVEQSTPIPAELLAPTKKGNTTLSVERLSPTKVVFRLE